MGKWDCRICEMEFSEMIHPVTYRNIQFCSPECVEMYKARHPVIKNRPKRKTQGRSPGMGVWNRDGGSVDYEGYK